MPTHILLHASRGIDSHGQPVDLRRMALFDDGTSGPRSLSSLPSMVDTESTVHSNLRGKLNPPGFIQDNVVSVLRMA